MTLPFLILYPIYIKIQLICACLLYAAVCWTLCNGGSLFLLLSASCSSSNPTGETSTSSTFSTIPIWEFSPNHSSETAALQAPRVFSLSSPVAPSLPLPHSLWIALILLSGPLPLPSENLPSHFLPLIFWLLLTIFIPLLPKHGSPQEPPLLLFSCSM